MVYVQLFLSFFKIGLFGFGGGLAIMSMIQHEVEKYGWMTQGEFVDIVAISQVTPGPIGINCATYVGYTATGSVWGSALTTGAIILPSLLIMLAVARLYFFLSSQFKENRYFQNVLRVLRWAVIGLIGAAALALINESSFGQKGSWVFFAVVFIVTLLPDLVKKKALHPQLAKAIKTLSHPILLIVVSGVIGYWLYR